MRRVAACILAVLWCLGAEAESFTERFERANALLASGDSEGALGIYRDLQIDDPESDVLYYGTGCAQYEQGLDKGASEIPDEASEAFETAEASFLKATLSANPEVRRNAGYNLANTAAQLAKLGRASAGHETTVAAFEESIEKYEDFLARYPGHREARDNLEHMRFLLKEMLQNPPPPQDEQENTGQGEEQEQQDKSQEEPQPSSGEQDGEQQDEQQEEEAPSMGEAAQAEKQEEPQEEPAELEPDQRQNIEAILQSLEDQDNREQREIKTGGRHARITKEWW